MCTYPAIHEIYHICLNNICIKILMLFFCAFLLKLSIDLISYNNNHIVFYIKL